MSDKVKRAFIIGVVAMVSYLFSGFIPPSAVKDGLCKFAGLCEEAAPAK